MNIQSIRIGTTSFRKYRPIFKERQHKEYNNRFIIIDKSRNIQYHLTPETADILSMCDGRSTVNQIINGYIENHQEHINLDRLYLEMFLRTMVQLGVLDIKAQPSRTRASWIITYQCNLICKHCYIQAGTDCGPELNLKDCLAIVDEIGREGFRLISFSGGEPLMKKGFLKIIKRASEYGIINRLCTNGTLITPDLAKALSLSNLIAVQVSIDGAISTTHDSIRGKGTFNKTIRGINYLLDVGVPVEICTVLTNKTIPQLEKIANLCISMGVKVLLFADLIKTGRALKTSCLKLKINSTTKDALLTRLKKKYYGELEINTSVNEEMNSYTQKRGTKFKIICTTLPSGIAINPFGEIFLCNGFLSQHRLSKMTDYTIGRLPVRSLKSILMDRSKMLRQFLQHNNSQSKKSEYCLLNYIESKNVTR